MTARPLKVAVVEDDPEVLDVLDRFLTHCGHAVAPMPNGRTAAARADEAFDAWIIDLHLPDLDGLEVAVRIRKNRPDVLLVLTTGFVDRERVDAAGHVSGAVFVSKPLDFARLQDVLSRAVVS